MNYYIINTKEESDLCLEECYKAHMKHHGENAEYSEGTIRWAELKTRLTDGKYIIPVCNHYSNPHRFIMETSSPNWFDLTPYEPEEQI